MKKLLTIAVILFISCNTNKTYKYIEHINDPDLIGDGYTLKDKEAVIIKANNDEDAYSQAYEKFSISKKVSKDMNEAYGHSAIPVSFEILNDKGEDISSKIDVLAKDSVEKSLDKSIGGMKTAIKEMYDSNQKLIEFKLKDCPVKILSAKPVEQEYSNYKDIRLSWKNISKKTISAIRFKWKGENAFGEPADMGVKTGEGGGFSDDKLRPGKSDYGEWSILSRDLKKVTKAWVYEVAFEDGTKWELNN